MHPFTETLTQALAVVGHASAVVQPSGVLNVSSPVDMAQFRRALALVDFGAFATGQVVFGWYAGNNSLMTTAGTTNTPGGVTASTTGPIGSTLTAGAATAATRVEKLEIRADQMPSGYRYLQLQATVTTVATTAAPTFGIIILGADANYFPANQFETTAYASASTGSAIVDQSAVT